MALVGACTGSASIEQGWSAPVVQEGSLFIGSRSGRFFKLNAGDVSETQPVDLASKNMVPQWQYPIGGTERGSTLGAIYGRPEVSPSLVYIATNRVERGVPTKGQLSALDRTTGAEKWTFETKGRVFGSPVLADGSLYVADEVGRLYALESATGRPLWEQAVAQKRFWTSPTFANGTLYVGSMDRRLYAVNAADGSVKWTFEAGGAITSRPLVIGDGVFVGAFDRRFYRVSAATGQKDWEFAGDGWFWNDAIASPDQSLVLVGSLGKTFYGLEANTGRSRWTFETGSAIRAAPVLAGNTVYVVAQDGRIFALDAITGKQTRSGGILEERVLASPAWSGGYLYIHDMKEKLHKRSAPA
jgi:outer membrane protein assembly factor BamB